MPYYRRNLYALSVVIFLAAFSWNQIIPFLPKFLEQLHTPKAELMKWTGLIFALQALAPLIAMPFWGKLGDSYGRKPMIIRAGIFLSAIYFGMSFCQTPAQLAVFRFLNGALTGFIPGSFALIATNTPEEHAPGAIATGQSASAAGLIIGPAIGGFLAGLVGYRGSMQLSGLIVLASTVLVWRLVQEPNKPKPIAKTSLIEDFLISLRSPVQLAILFAVFVSWSFAAAINPFLVPHLENIGGRIPLWLSSSVIAIPAVAFVLFAQSWTRFGGNVGYERAIYIGIIGCCIGAFLLALPNTVWLFAIIYFATGIWLTALSPSIGALTCTEVDESFRGRAYGIQQSAGTLGALITPLVAGIIGDAIGIRYIFVFVGVFFMLGCFVYAILVRRWKRSMK
jgi:DHA1 family multidrug resistance protein-like MFS transporter